MSQFSILCYGDSNTWGYVPTAEHSEVKLRYPYHERWTGILQTLLGKEYYVIEEGLNSRTTNLNYQNPPDRNGKTYLPPCLYSQSPLNLVILALGGNDCKTYFNRNAEDICQGMEELVDLIQTSPYGPHPTTPPKILLIGSPPPQPIAETFKDEEGVQFMQGSIEKMRKLVGLYANLAKTKNCHFLDLSHSIHASNIDGVHLNKEEHAKVAKFIAEKIKEEIF